MKTPFITKKQFNKIRKFLPVPRGNKKIDDIIFLSGVICIVKNALPWRHLPKIYGNWKTIYSRFILWSAKGLFEIIFKCLGIKAAKSNIGMLGSTFSKAHRTSASLKHDGKPREIGRTRGGITSKIHFLCNDKFMPLDFCITGGEVHDAKMAKEFIRKNGYRLKIFIADKAYDSNKIRKTCVHGGLSKSQKSNYI